MRYNFDITGPEAVDNKTTYHLLTALVVPRPIAWISTISSSGVDNLAPHSFFTVACREPAIVQFTSVGNNDTLKNVMETGEFVINSSPVQLFEQINMTGTNYPSEISEFDAVGLTREASSVVRAPRVRESPAAIECRLNRIVELGDSWIVLGDVVHVAVQASVIELDGKHAHPSFDLLQPLSRLGRDEWGEPGSVRRIARAPFYQ